MDPYLLPVQVPHLQHATLSEERIRMVLPPPPYCQPREPLLVVQKRLCKGGVPTALKVPPHQQAVLEMGEDKTIIE